MAKKKTHSSKASASGKAKEIITEQEMRYQQERARIANKHKQMREQQYTHGNNLKIDSQWRKIKRKEKVQDLRRFVEILSQNHERDVDRKDAFLQILDKDLDQCEEQHQHALRGHRESTEKLLALHVSTVEHMQRSFEERCEEIQQQFNTENGRIQADHGRRTLETGNLIALMENEFAEVEADDKQEFEARREEIKNKNAEEYNVLKIQLEGNVDELERRLEEVHKTYQNTTEHKTRGFEQLSANDTSAARVIEKRTRYLKRLQEALSYWKQRICTSVAVWKDRNSALRKEKELMSRNYRALKGSLENFRTAQTQRLKHLSVHSRKAEDLVREKLQTAESILKLWRMSQSFETEKEQILPFCSTLSEFHVRLSSTPLSPRAEDCPGTDTSQEEKAVKYDDNAQLATRFHPSSASHSSTALDSNGTEVEKRDALQNFFIKYNSAIRLAAEIEQEKSVLEQENRNLRAFLKRYLDNISVNPEALDDPLNSLVIINNKLQDRLKARN